MRRRRVIAGLSAALAAPTIAAFGPFVRSAGPQTFDVALVLAADVSRSINDDEFALQRRGYAAAIVDPRVLDAIRSGPRGAIALIFVEWAGESEQKTVIDWTLIGVAADAQKFADALLAAPRSFVGRTAIGTALDHALSLIGESGFAADHYVIDVSGDGTSNQGRIVTDARDATVAAGATINGLSIFNKTAAAQGGYLVLQTNPPGRLAEYYGDHVIGGPGAFVVPIDDFTSFDQAMIHKLISEIADVRGIERGRRSPTA
jgi:Protein of unknown function (DUF1194)